MPSLPALIFADDNHTDPFLDNILSKLAPKLKQLGYENYYHEVPGNMTIDQLIKENEKTIEQINKAAPTVIKLGKEMGKTFDAWTFLYNDMSKAYEYTMESTTYKLRALDGTEEYALLALLATVVHTQKEKFGISLSETVINDIAASMSETILSASSIQVAAINFLKTIKANGLHYQGIDDQVVWNLPLTFNSFKSLEKASHIETQLYGTLKKRNKHMAYAYLQAQSPVFGFTGLMHVTGLQEMLSTLIPKEIAAANFNFIYMYHSPIDPLENQLNPDANKCRESMRQGKENLPLGITLVDGINKSEDEIVEEVMKKIEAKIAEFKALPESLKQIPDLSYAGQLRAAMSNVYGLFSTAKRTAASTITHALGYESEPPAKRQRV